MPQVMVKVKFFSTIAAEIGLKAKQMPVDANLHVALEQIQASLGYALLEPLRVGKIALLLNGRAVQSTYEQTDLKNDDALAFLPIMGGG